MTLFIAALHTSARTVSIEGDPTRGKVAAGAWRECGGVGRQEKGPAGAQHERAGRAKGLEARPALPLAVPDRAANGYGHLTRSRPQDSASNAAAPQWEPRKPLAEHKKAPPERRLQRGQSTGVELNRLRNYPVGKPEMSVK